MELQLERRALYQVPDAAGMRISCCEGSVWITLDNDPRDIVLEAGQSFSIQAHRRAIVYAMEAARIRVAEVARQSRKPTMDMFSRFHAMPLRKAAR